MQGNFAVGFLEILAYLAPGFIVEAVIIYIIFDPTKIPESPTWIALIILVGYVIGHALTVISLPLVRFRDIIKRIQKEKSCEERYSFYLDLRSYFQQIFGSDIERTDEYFYALRLVIEYCPRSANTIDRLTALALFSRNTCASFLLCVPALFLRNIPLAIISIILTFLFFMRYLQFERGLEGTVFRVAYMYLVANSNRLANITLHRDSSK